MKRKHHKDDSRIRKKLDEIESMIYLLVTREDHLITVDDSALKDMWRQVHHMKQKYKSEL